MSRKRSQEAQRTLDLWGNKYPRPRPGSSNTQVNVGDAEPNPLLDVRAGVNTQNQMSAKNCVADSETATVDSALNTESCVDDPDKSKLAASGLEVSITAAETESKGEGESENESSIYNPSSDPEETLETKSSLQKTGNNWLHPNHQIDGLPTQKLKDKTLSFQVHWYRDYPWLHFDQDKQKMLCFICLEATEKGLHLSATSHEATFMSIGFNNWKKGNEKFRIHQNSNFHKQSTAMLAALSKMPISVDLQKASENAKIQSRGFLSVLFSSVMYLAKQGIALRGDKHDGGNFMELLYLRAKDVPGLSTWLNRSKPFTSWAIQNEILQIVAHFLLRKVMKEINEAKFYSLIVDETTDASVSEQVSVNVKVVDCKFEAKEFFLGLVKTESTTGESLYGLIRDVLLRFNLPIDNLRGQCYDGAANMSGKFKGLQARLLKDQPKAVFVHCFAHSLNLALQDVAKSNVFVRDVLTCAHEVAKLIKDSPQRMAKFAQVCEASNSDSPKPRPLCPTRWTIRVQSVEWILKSYEGLLELLAELGDSNDSCALKAQGLRRQMENGEPFLGLLITKHVFMPCERLSKLLQNPTASVAGSLESAQITISELNSKKTQGFFQELWNEMEAKIPQFGLAPPSLPRKRITPKRYRQVNVQREFETAKEKLCSTYFDLVEILCREISRRFTQSNLNYPANCEKVLLSFPKSLSDETKDELKEICTFYGWSSNSILNQLDVFKNYKSVQWNSVDNIVKGFQSLSADAKEMFPDLGLYLKHMLVIPSSSAGAERSFSMLRRIKTYLRTTMGQERLNHCCVINAYSDVFGELCIDELMNEFISKGNRDAIFSLKL